jgi:hypothetical protein
MGIPWPTADIGSQDQDQAHDPVAEPSPTAVGATSNSIDSSTHVGASAASKARSSLAIAIACGSAAFIVLVLAVVAFFYALRRARQSWVPVFDLGLAVDVETKSNGGGSSFMGLTPTTTRDSRDPRDPHDYKRDSSFSEYSKYSQASLNSYASFPTFSSLLPKEDKEKKAPIWIAPLRSKDGQIMRPVISLPSPLQG